nr:MAG TPA: hypothetical protein [Caudoviricetes sp.]
MQHRKCLLFNPLRRVLFLLPDMELTFCALKALTIFPCRYTV